MTYHSRTLFVGHVAPSATTMTMTASRQDASIRGMLSSSPRGAFPPRSNPRAASSKYRALIAALKHFHYPSPPRPRLTGSVGCRYLPCYGERGRGRAKGGGWLHPSRRPTNYSADQRIHRRRRVSPRRRARGWRKNGTGGAKGVCARALTSHVKGLCVEAPVLASCHAFPLLSYAASCAASLAALELRGKRKCI